MNTAHHLPRALAVLFAATLLCASGSAQVMTVVSTQSTGSATNVVLSILNDTGAYIVIFHSPFLFLLTADGELAQPRYPVCSDVLYGVAPGATLGGYVSIPDPPVTAPGSYLLYFPYGQGAVMRLDVGAPSPGFSDIHVFPAAIWTGFTSHAFDIWGGPTNWTIANASSNAFTFGAGDSLSIEPAGGGASVATVALAGLSIAPGKTLSIPIPPLPPAPYLVDVRWNDPAAGSQVRRIGLRDFHNVDLQFPRGRQVPLGGSIDAALALRYDGPLIPTPVYALAVGSVPGSVVLPGGAVLPLGLDPLAVESVTTGLSGLLLGNVGGTSSVYVNFCAGLHFLSPTITLFHPNVPSLSGAILRVAAAVYDPVNGQWGASQLAEIRLQ